MVEILEENTSTAIIIYTSNKKKFDLLEKSVLVRLPILILLVGNYRIAGRLVNNMIVLESIIEYHSFMVA